MNKMTFLETCTADFSPRLLTDLKDKFDKNARCSSAFLINDNLIECGPNTLNSLDILKIPHSKLKISF